MCIRDRCWIVRHLRDARGDVALDYVEARLPKALGGVAVAPCETAAVDVYKRQPFTEHAFLEPECAVGFPYKNGVKAVSYTHLGFSFGALLGGEIVGGAVAVLFGLAYSKIKWLFPPVVTGTVI